MRQTPQRLNARADREFARSFPQLRALNWRAVAGTAGGPAGFLFIDF